MASWREVLEAPDWVQGTGHGLEPIPEWFRKVAEPALADLQLPVPVDLCLGYEPAWTCHPRTLEWMRLPDEGMLWVWEPGFLGASGYELLAGDEPFAERVVSFAFWLQEQVYPETDAAWGQPRPSCPGHPHPASPRERDGQAWWVCPVDDREIGVIGTLADVERGASRRPSDDESSTRTKQSRVSV